MKKKRLSSNTLGEIVGKFRCTEDTSDVWRVRSILLENSTKELIAECTPKRFLQLFSNAEAHASATKEPIA